MSRHTHVGWSQLPLHAWYTHTHSHTHSHTHTHIHAHTALYCCTPMQAGCTLVRMVHTHTHTFTHTYIHTLHIIAAHPFPGWLHLCAHVPIRECHQRMAAFQRRSRWHPHTSGSKQVPGSMLTASMLGQNRLYTLYVIVYIHYL